MNEDHGFKDKIILFCWIAGLLILISVIWISSQSIQKNYLLRAVNNVLISNNDPRRISVSLPQKSGRTGLLGYWYSMYNSASQMFVFTVFQDGVLVPLGAVVSSSGSVEEIIPLSAHAVQIFNSFPKSILQMYILKIEKAALVNMELNSK